VSQDHVCVRAQSGSDLDAIIGEVQTAQKRQVIHVLDPSNLVLTKTEYLQSSIRV